MERLDRDMSGKGATCSENAIIVEFSKETSNTLRLLKETARRSHFENRKNALLLISLTRQIVALLMENCFKESATKVRSPKSRV